MYDELAESLRRTANTWLAEEYKVCAEALRYQLKEAADAIEELICEVADERNARLDAEEKQRWIPVTERLPYPGDKVIVAIRDESGDTRFDFTNTGWWSGYGYKFVVEDEFCSWVTHWMPLPEPPKEE